MLQSEKKRICTLHIQPNTSINKRILRTQQFKQNYKIGKKKKKVDRHITEIRYTDGKQTST